MWTVPGRRLVRVQGVRVTPLLGPCVVVGRYGWTVRLVFCGGDDVLPTWPGQSTAPRPLDRTPGRHRNRVARPGGMVTERLSEVGYPTTVGRPDPGQWCRCPLEGCGGLATVPDLVEVVVLRSVLRLDVHVDACKTTGVASSTLSSAL